MHNKISKLAKREVLEALRQRYRQAPKQEKAKKGSACAVSGISRRILV